jgi:hypothetical protein
MCDRSPGPVSTFICLVAAIASASTPLLSILLVSTDRTRFHDDAANSGFVDLATAPAGKGSCSGPDLGTFAPGAGPVIGPDGAVYWAQSRGN